MKNNSDAFQIKISRFKHHSAPSQIMFEYSSLKSPPQLCSPTNLSNSQGRLDSKKVQRVKQFMSEHKGSINPIEYKQEYSFSEKWQAVSKEASSDNSRFRQISGKLKTVNFLVFPLLIVHIWFISIYRVFKYENNQWVFGFGLALEVTGLLYQVISIAYEADQKRSMYHRLVALLNKKGFLIVSGSLYSIIYHSIGLAGGNALRDFNYLFLLPFDGLLIFYKYQILQQIYSIIRIEAIGSKYKLFMNLFDLAGNIFMMIHSFAILLFLTTYHQPNNNWHTISPISADDNWLSYYIQSFYFACTTMLTVGFGDIRPTNLLQVGCVLVVQLVGIMNNAYVISQIGANLLLIHEQRNNLQKDIANAQKIIKSNGLSTLLSNKMMDNLVNNQPVNEELSIAEEEILLGKLSEQFKSQVKQNNQLRVIKKNLFLITSFTGRFQSQLSKKLVKVIYPPHSVLPNHQRKQRLHIITKGAVDIVTEKKYRGRSFPEKVIKCFNVDKSSVLNAVYGYASLFSGRATRIKAVASNFAVCYYLQHQDILQNIHKFTDDFETYFQIKHKLELYRIPQKYQIPNITSHRQNYMPNIYVLIKKEKVNKKTNRRRRIIRNERRIRKMIESFEDQVLKGENGPISSGDSITATFQEQSHKRQGTIILPVMQSPMITKPRNHRWCNNLQLSRKYEELRKLRLQQKQNEQLHLCVFSQSVKQYKNYFPKGNLTNIASKYNRGKKGAVQQAQTLTMNSTRLDQLRWKRMKSIGK